MKIGRSFQSINDPWIKMGFQLFFVLLLPIVATGSLKGQELADYDYEKLAFRGISVEYGNILFKTYEETEVYSVKLDLGFLGPGVRMATRASYWSSEMVPEELVSFESSLNTMILAQGGVLPGNGLEIGSIKRDDMSVSVEADYVWRIPLGMLLSTGLGASAHLVNGTTQIPDDTFLNGLLDSFTAGFNVHSGLEYLVTDRIRLYGDSRIGLAGNVRFFQFGGGLTILWGELLSGESR
ncbi:MAG: hypothetical protein MK221_05375 [Gemmatimonadetes bacterium]|jgi:hypothetical protein|nr:hypothetical protein [Gemmatimonadota bacterium]MEE2879871.1 hypothetical protein [Gemmatimonadota bacterium]|tara:strand:- start:2805 stop:3518 length:714 start_codon:yes stop_codon:yes gene_type:complete